MTSFDDKIIRWLMRGFVYLGFLLLASAIAVLLLSAIARQTRFGVPNQEQWARDCDSGETWDMTADDAIRCQARIAARRWHNEEAK